jgi:RNA-binding protein 26
MEQTLSTCHLTLSRVSLYHKNYALTLLPYRNVKRGIVIVLNTDMLLEYDPHNSLMTTIDHPSTSPTVAAPLFPNFDSSRGNDRGRGRSKIQRGDRTSSNGALSRRGGRAEFSSDRPNFDRTNTTIVVENIPEERFSEDVVREFFTEFGSIAEINMRPYKRLALVKYDDWSAAKAAYSSPKVIFDNRFVKVYWYTNPDSLPQVPLATNKNETLGNVNGTSSPTTARATSEPRIDLEEFTRKQQEAQKVHEEKMKKKAEMEAAQKELERRQEELLKKQAEEKRKLMEKLAAKTSKSGTSSVTEQNGTKAASNGKPSSQTEALKAQLAALEAEARSLGLDTALTDDTSWGSRGRGRGRGAYRGRGAFIPRGRGFERGGYRGRGATVFGGAAASYKLDNRPKKISLTGIDFTDSEKDESLRQYLLVCSISVLVLEIC